MTALTLWRYRLGALWCSTWFGYCAHCQLWLCTSRAEPYGESRRRPKPKDYAAEQPWNDSGDGSI